MKRSASIANKVYRFVHDRDVWICTNILDRDFENELLRVAPDGRITVKGSSKKGYAWDGCSPKGYFLHFIWGTPDGKMDYRTEKPITYYASMIHDVIYQFKSEVNISRKEADMLFKCILRESGFMWWWFYLMGVRIGGGFFGKWKRKKSQSRIVIKESSWLLNISA